ncbi:Superfamily II DNA and RNA helicase [Giardia duodenalis]|uniref:Superfamily II DNA and RNA helicase n=1 Tax=Giardia intestinalis TaxID=5741 RepID=V6TE56_GIAIN|nr:Superfamily II DNA and RNA helicase [Giardia intestinalis]
MALSYTAPGVTKHGCPSTEAAFETSSSTGADATLSTAPSLRSSVRLRTKFTSEAEPFAIIVLATYNFARGLDLPAVRSVVNFELPESLATLTHRVGRCARGLNSGVAISVRRSEVEYKFDTLVNFDPSRVVSIDEESLCDYRGTEGPRLSDFSVGDSDVLEISRRFSENMDVYLTTLYDGEFGR